MKTIEELTELIMTLRSATGPNDYVTIDLEFGMHHNEAKPVEKWKAYCGEHGHSDPQETPEKAVRDLLAKMPGSITAKVVKMRGEADRLEALAKDIAAKNPAVEPKLVQIHSGAEQETQ